MRGYNEIAAEMLTGSAGMAEFFPEAPLPASIYWTRNPYWTMRGPGVGRGWHDADPLPPPILMPDLCPTLKGSGLTLADVSAAIYETHAMLKAAGPEYDGEDVRRAMILNRLEARLNEARAVRASS